MFKILFIVLVPTRPPALADRKPVAVDEERKSLYVCFRIKGLDSGWMEWASCERFAAILWLPAGNTAPLTLRLPLHLDSDEFYSLHQVDGVNFS